MDLKKLFEGVDGGKLSYDEFQAKLKEGKIKLANLEEGGYVSKDKYEDELKAKDEEIDVLNQSLLTRDDDLAGLQEQLEKAGNDSDQLAEITKQFEELNKKYEQDVNSYKELLDNQAYEMQVKEFASGKQFSSNASKRDFVSSMMGEGLTVVDGKIIGAEEFMKKYEAENPDAFIKEQPSGEGDKPAPSFGAPTPGPDKGSAPQEPQFNFGFTPVTKAVNK